jgi:hypothetical protein
LTSYLADALTLAAGEMFFEVPFSVLRNFLPGATETDNSSLTNCVLVLFGYCAGDVDD